MVTLCPPASTLPRVTFPAQFHLFFSEAYGLLPMAFLQQTSWKNRLGKEWKSLSDSSEQWAIGRKRILRKSTDFRKVEWVRFFSLYSLDFPAKLKEKKIIQSQGKTVVSTKYQQPLLTTYNKCFNILILKHKWCQVLMITKHWNISGTISLKQ